MRDKAATRAYYIDKLGFRDIGAFDYAGYLMVAKDDIEIHFFEYPALNPKENYGQVYIRTNRMDELYAWISSKVSIHPNGALATKPWGQREFAILDPDSNLLTFGEGN